MPIIRAVGSVLKQQTEDEEQPTLPGHSADDEREPRSNQGQGGDGDFQDHVNQGGNQQANINSDRASRVEEFRILVQQGEEANLALISDYRLQSGLPFSTGTDDAPHGFGRTSATIGSLLAQARSWSTEEIERMQELLYQAGYFDEEYYDRDEDGRLSRQFSRGRYDDGTRRAFAALLRDGVINADRPLVQLLSSRAQDFAETGVTAGGRQVRGARVGGGNVYDIILSDPDALASMTREIGRELMGREPDDASIMRAAARVRNSELFTDTLANNTREAAERERFMVDVAADQAYADAQLQIEQGGGMLNPVPGGTFTDTMGAPRSGGRRHMGTDIFAPRGTPVVAAVGGTVRQAGFGGSLGGNRVWVEGDDGRFYYYAHLDTIGAARGERVEVGQQIGTVGNTGNAANTPSHLHFSINSRMGSEDGIGNAAHEIGHGATVVDTGEPQTSVDVAGRDTYLEPRTVITDEVNPAASIEAQLREENPEEIGAHDIAKQYDVFRGLLGKTIG